MYGLQVSPQVIHPPIHVAALLSIVVKGTRQTSWFGLSFVDKGLSRDVIDDRRSRHGRGSTRTEMMLEVTLVPKSTIATGIRADIVELAEVFDFVVRSKCRYLRRMSILVSM